MRTVLLAALLVGAAHAQPAVDGRVTDATTGDGLPSATVQVEGTSRGTITNRDGAYRLAIPEGGDTLVVRFLGYETARVRIPADGGRLDVALRPVVASLGEAVVTAGNPAEAIMRRVIERKARWRGSLRRWRAEVYSRQTIRADSQVVAVIEGQTVAYWDRQRGLREVVTATRRTGNLGTLPIDAFAAAEQTLNLYDDDVPFGGYTLAGPTHPRALAFYRFTLDGSRALGSDLVYDLSFTPRNPLQPGLTGTLSVLAGADAVVAISARPSDAVQFPLVQHFALTLEQQFSPFGQSVDGEAVWLPVDFRMDGAGRAGNALLRFPHLGFAVNSRFTDYEVNVAVPDSLFEHEGVAVDSASVAEARPVAGVVPLSVEEERALAEIDSTQSLSEALRPRGPLARFVRVSAGGDRPNASGPPSRRIQLGAEPAVWYNRVEGVHLGGRATARTGGHRVEGVTGYDTGSKHVVGSASAMLRLSPTVYVGGAAHADVAALGRSIYVDRSVNTLAAALAATDYFDYVEQTGGQLWAGWWGAGRWAPNALLSAAIEEYDVAPVTSRTSLTGDLPADNVLDPTDRVDRVGLRLRAGGWNEGLPLALTGQRAATVWIEGGRAWEADAAQPYGRVEGEVRWVVSTMLRRRLLEPQLHLRLAVGTASAALPVERAFGLDGRLAGVAPFGALRARGGRLTLARCYALVAWEHDLRSVPFEILGWRGSAPLGLSFQVHGAHAWADVPPTALREPRVVHHEVGASVGLGYTIPLRIDLTYRLTDEPGLLIGLGMARLF